MEPAHLGTVSSTPLMKHYKVNCLDQDYIIDVEQPVSMAWGTTGGRGLFLCLMQGCGIGAGCQPWQTNPFQCMKLGSKATDRLCGVGPGSFYPQDPGAKHLGCRRIPSAQSGDGLSPLAHPASTAAPRWPTW